MKKISDSVLNLKKIILLPTYNEEKNISKVIKSILNLNYNFDILVIDDNSKDNTLKIVKQLMKKNKNIDYIKREKKLGLATAYFTGFDYALKRDYELIFEMDSDFSHNPNDLKKFLIAIKKYDVVIGSRYKTGISVVNWSFKRLLISKFATYYANLFSKKYISDMTSGFICYRADVLRNIDYNSITSNGYSFQIEMKYKVLDNNFSIYEVPIIFTDRKYGNSKFSLNIILEAIWIVFKYYLSKKMRKI